MDPNHWAGLTRISGEIALAGVKASTKPNGSLHRERAGQLDVQSRDREIFGAEISRLTALFTVKFHGQ